MVGRYNRSVVSHRRTRIVFRAHGDGEEAPRPTLDAASRRQPAVGAVRKHEKGDPLMDRLLDRRTVLRLTAAGAGVVVASRAGIITAFAAPPPLAKKDTYTVGF